MSDASPTTNELDRLRTLIRRYVDHVVFCEGRDYLDEGYVEQRFTDAEIAELRRADDTSPKNHD